MMKKLLKLLLMVLGLIGFIGITGYCTYQYYNTESVICIWGWILLLVTFSAGYALCER